MAPDTHFIRYRTTGDEVSFRALVEEHLAMVHAVAVRRLGPHAHLAADVAQAVFSRLARAAGALPADLVPAPWLHRQAVRLAIDTVRKEERRLVRETTAAAAAMLHTLPEVPDSPAAALLDEALDQLPAGDRSVLVLHYLEDRDFAAVAAALGSTPEAARKRIARSLEKLRTLLSRRGVALTTAALMSFLTEQSSHAAPASLALQISSTAWRTAGSGQAGFLLTTALVSHGTAIAAGAIAALLACGLFYQQREKQMARESALRDAAVTAGQTGKSLSWQSGQDEAPALPSTLPEIIAAVDALTAAPQHRLTMERISALLRRVRPEQYLEFYTVAEARLRPVCWEPVLHQSVLLWKEVNPEALTRALFESDTRKRALISETAVHLNMAFNSFEISNGRYAGNGMSTRIRYPFEKWLERDFDAARQWLASVAGDPLMKIPLWNGITLNGELANWVAKRLPPDGPLESLPTRSLNPGQTTLLRERWANHLIDQTGDFGKVLTVSAGNAEEARLLAHYCAMRDPDACQRAIAAMPDADRRFAAALGYVSQHSIQEKNQFTSLDANARLPRAKFAFEQAGARTVSDSLRDIVQACVEPAARGTDAVRAWALEKGGAESSAALADAARRFAEHPWLMQMALEWAGAVPDAAQRGPLLRGIYQRWSDNAPEAAAKYLQTAVPELAASLQPLAPPESP